MFKGMMDSIKDLIERAKNPPRFDPSLFDDELATQIDWGPAKNGGTNFCTHKLKKVSSSKVQFVPSVGALFFYGIFFVIGIFVMTFMTYSMYKQEGQSPDLLFPIIFGAVFSAIGGTMLYFGTKPIIFDKMKNYYLKGREQSGSRSVQSLSKDNKNKNKISLSQVHAIQVVSEWIRGNKSSYTSYELNLVLKDGSRINVIDHGHRKKLYDDAQTLSAFLGIPLWDKDKAYVPSDQ